MKKILGKLLNRIVIFGILLAVQLGWFLLTFTKLVHYSTGPVPGFPGHKYPGSAVDHQYRGQPGLQDCVDHPDSGSGRFWAACFMWQWATSVRERACGRGWTRSGSVRKGSLSSRKKSWDGLARWIRDERRVLLFGRNRRLSGLGSYFSDLL